MPICRLKAKSALFGFAIVLCLFCPSAKTQVAKSCSVTPTALPTGSSVTAIMPMSVYDGTITNLTVVGTKLNTAWSILLCPKTTASPSPTLPVPGTVNTTQSSASQLQLSVTAAVGSTGDYSVYLDNAGTVYNTGQIFGISSSTDTKYVACAAPANLGKPNVNLACSFVPLSFETALEVFGKGVANRFIAVEVIVENKNATLEYLLQDVRVGTPDFILSSYDKKIPRGVSEKEEQFSARAIIVRLTAAGASVLTGVAGFEGGVMLQNIAGLVAGPVQTGLQSTIPDLSTAELARLDDLGFSTTSTVISKDSSIAVVAFIPSDTLKPMKISNTPWHWVHTPNSYSTYKGTDLKALFSSLIVQVAGTHVQDENPSQPTLKLFLVSTANTVSLPALQANGLTANIEGSSLNNVAQVLLADAPDKASISATLKPLAGESTVDPNVAVLTVPSSAAYIAGTYEIFFVLADGTSIDTKEQITVTPPSPAATPTFSPVQGAVTSGQVVTISSTTPGAIIYYAINGTATTAASSSGASPVQVTVTAAETINAIAVASGFSTSTAATAAYTITAQ